MVKSERTSLSTWCMIALAVLTVATLGRLGTAEFVSWDDELTIYKNPHFTPPPEDIGWFWHNAWMDLYVPVTYTVWGGLVRFARVDTPDAIGSTVNPWVFHTANVLVHTLSALVVFSILRMLLRKAATDRIAELAALAGAALFAIHPLQVEAVAWASGMKDLLCGLFSLSSIRVYLLWAQAPRETTSKNAAMRPAMYALATILYVAALLSKPSAIVTPLFVLIIDLLVLRRRPAQVLRAVLPWALAALPIIVIAKQSQPAPQIVMTPFWSRPLIAGDSLAFYLRKLVLPFDLALDYERPPRYLLKQWWFYLTWIVPVVAAAAIFLWKISEKRWIVAAGLLMIAGLFPVLGLVNFDYESYSTVADHYLYLPMLGIALAASWSLTRRPTRGVAAAAATILFACALRSWHQTGYWLTDERLFAHAIQVTPESFMMHNNYGLIFLKHGRVARAEGRPQDADRLFEQAEEQIRTGMRYEPGRLGGFVNLFSVLIEQGKDELAVRELSWLLTGRSKMSEGKRNYYQPLYCSLGTLLLERGQYSAAVEALREAVRQKPDDAISRAALADAQTKLRAETSSTKPGPP